MKTHRVLKQHKKKTFMIEQYYHRSMRVWVSYKIDDEGTQIADCEYAVDKDVSASLACENKNFYPITDEGE